VEKQNPSPNLENPQKANMAMVINVLIVAENKPVTG